MLRVSVSLLFLSLSISSPMFSSESSLTNLRASILASSSAIGCSKSRNFRSIRSRATPRRQTLPSTPTPDKSACPSGLGAVRATVSSSRRRAGMASSLVTPGRGRMIARDAVGTRRSDLDDYEPGGAMSVQKIVLLVALLLALVAAFVTIPYAAPILGVLGLIAGFSMVREEHVRVIVSALALKYLGDTFGAIPQVGAHVPTIIGTIALLAAGAALMIIFRNIYAYSATSTPA